MKTHTLHSVNVNRDKICARLKYLGINNFVLIPTGLPVEIWQFERGSQGSCRQVAVYMGYIIRLNLPILHYRGCASSVLEYQEIDLAFISNNLYKIENWSSGDKITLASDESFESECDQLMRKKQGLEKELAEVNKKIQNCI